MGEVMLTEESLTGYIKTRDLAKVLGVSDRRIQDMTKQEILHKADAEIGKKGVYKMPDVLREYRASLSESARGHKVRNESEENLEKAKLAAEVEYKKAKAKKAQTELKEYEGTYHRADDVEKLVTELVFSIRNALMSMPGRLSVACEGKMAAEISLVIRTEVYDILNRLAEHKYDPESYRKLVREREGFTALDRKDESEDDDEE